MGIDVRYLAMPPWFPRASEDGDDLVTLSFAIEKGGKWRGPPLSEDGRRIYEDTVPAILAAHPGIATRCHAHHERDWDVLHWLVSPARRGEGPDDVLASAFVRGEEEVPGARATQGKPIRATRADRIAAVLARAERIDEATLRRTHREHPCVDATR